MVFLFLLLVPVALELIFEGATLAVYGTPMSEADLDSYLGKNLSIATLNSYDNEILSMRWFASILPFPIFTAKWVISGFGTVPRWSKWSKKLDERRRELISEYLTR